MEKLFKIGDLVVLNSNPSVPMTIVEVDTTNPEYIIYSVFWLLDGGSMTSARLPADAFSRYQ